MPNAADQQLDGMVLTATIRLVGAPPRAALERAAYFPDVADPVVFGVRPEFASFYGVNSTDYEARPTTNDAFSAAVASCMMGTFSGALKARGVTVTSEQLAAEVVTDVGPSKSTGRWVFRSIHVRFVVDLPEGHHEMVRRVHGFFDRDCWLSQTLAGSECNVDSEIQFI